MEPQLGLVHFLAQTDGVGKFVLALLLAMSVATWYLILTKAMQVAGTRKRSRRFLSDFWAAANLAEVHGRIHAQGAHDPFSALAHDAFTAVEQHARRGGERLIDAGAADEYLTRALRRSIERTTARLESGLTVLASVGSAAPFVGLFGTVWGIYHALVAIGLSGQGTLEKVAGPVGEALVMTAAGLAVAIPAVLAYNALVRSNRMLLAELDGFAHDVFAFASTGARAGETVAPAVPAAGIQPLPRVAQAEG
ncbi:MAG: MotA/TolQ/ExbB proton channel family protein [Burkholderiales bacterium]|nr:MotA/TolQ/ExbB proton channel family protein [Burkholderiales bacterium]